MFSTTKGVPNRVMTRTCRTGIQFSLGGIQEGVGEMKTKRRPGGLVRVIQVKCVWLEGEGTQ